jgi:Domain of unknown function (DUF4062)
VKTVFLSSVSAGLEPYRAAVHDAIHGLDGYHCVWMEDFGARNFSSEEVCRQKVVECDIFVGIIGQRYGSCPPGSDKSYTEIEHDIAEKENKVRLMFPAHEEFPVPTNPIETPEQQERLKMFRQRVLDKRNVEFFDSESDLALSVVKAIHNCRDTLPAPTPEKESRRTYLLFPWVKCEGSIDTGIVILNTGSDPFGTVGQAGVCIFHYYGSTANGGPPGGSQASAVVRPGELLWHCLTQNTTAINLLSSRTGFTGYVIVECDFPYAHGTASVNNSGGVVLVSYFATVIKRDRSGE